MTRRKLVVSGLPAPDTRLKIASEPPFSLDVDQLRPVEKDVLRLARDGASISDIVVTLGKDEGVVLRAAYGLYCAGLLEAIAAPERRRLRVQEETGTFVLSEIRRKVETKKVEVKKEVPPPRPVPAPAPVMFEEPAEPVIEPSSPPSIELLLETAEDPVIEVVMDEPAPERVPVARTVPRPIEEPVRTLSPPPAPVEARKEVPTPTPPRREFAWAKYRWLQSIARALWPLWDWIEKALLRFVGSDPVQLATFEASPPAPQPAVEPSVAPSHPAYSVRAERHTPSAPEPVEPPEPEVVEEERVEIPSWSILSTPEERNDLADVSEPSNTMSEMIGVPSWSSKDAPSATAPRPPREARRTDEPTGVPSWSMLDASRETPFELESSPQAWSFEEPKAVSEELAPLSSLDNELFIEGELNLEDAPSMLSHIPVEEIAEVELQIDVEGDTFAGLAEEVETEAVPFEASVIEERVIEAPVIEEPVIEEPFVEEPEPSPSPVMRERPAEEDARPRTRARRSFSTAVSSAPDSPAPVASEPTAETEEPAPPAEDPSGKHADAMLRARQSGGEARLFRDVKLHFKLQDWRGAVPLLEQLVHISPGSALYRGMLARAMSRDSMYRKDAEEHFIEALRLAPQDAELHYWLGLYYKSFGLKARAETEFRTVLRIDPKHQGARKQFGGGERKDDAIGTVFKKLFG